MIEFALLCAAVLLWAFGFGMGYMLGVREAG